ncbi:hypothetical protein [Nocardioides sp. P5_C9_2]
MSDPFTFFDASAAPDPQQPSRDDTLHEMSRTGVEASLDRALDHLDDVVARASARDRAEGVSPELARLLDEITGTDDAPSTWASLHRRVETGVTTWDSFWADPSVEEDGMRLVFEAMSRSGRRLAQGLASAREGQSGTGA